MVILRFISSTNNSVQPIPTNTKHGMPKQDNVDFCTHSSTIYYIVVVQNLFLTTLRTPSTTTPSTSTPLIKKPKNEHNLKNTNNNNNFQVSEPYISLKLREYNRNIIAKKIP